MCESCELETWRLNKGERRVEREGRHREDINNGLPGGADGAGGAIYALTSKRKQAEAQTQVQPQRQPHQTEARRRMTEMME